MILAILLDALQSVQIELSDFIKSIIAVIQSRNPTTEHAMVLASVFGDLRTDVALGAQLLVARRDNKAYVAVERQNNCPGHSKYSQFLAERYSGAGIHDTTR